ncbi:MAG: GFA family protein [Myxococcota bacterium]|nr:GFA family protein [Myxococcota bacterium]
MAESKYQGGCHCGAVRYHVDIDVDKGGMTCNCSICSRGGTILSFVPAAAFELEKGEDQLVNYQFNKKHIDHLFCKTCGIKSFARGKGRDGAEMIAINIRCLDNVDLEKVPTKAVDGKSF